MNTRYVVLLSHFDGSGVIQAFGPYNTRALADDAMADLQTWPALQDGRWEVVSCVETPGSGAPSELDQLQQDAQALAQVGRLYLDSLDNDPANEYLTLGEAMRVTSVREAVERQEARWAE